jgi:hypothetical protein
MPNYRTVKRRVDAIDAKEHLRKRAGAKAANDRFRPTRVLSTTDLLPLERVQIDLTLWFSVGDRTKTTRLQDVIPALFTANPRPTYLLHQALDR